ncbi:TetR/AcrR family transcriptional regulator [Staphylococcus pseudoxylosus]|uniref:TetR/AcrR family transcriptional regulator n=1 Tax=Staphylococcus pseudoxylosus TaxID=2282419 RepID=A0AAQ0MGY8_9STAP|nr:TetR/AcrR family transcriptional regulator [Staphylococcus pseudoxylosus]RQM85518.1 TetR family transcriptional regulator [Staphylococcus xylosus]MBM2658187.1 TetR/AcrR family transcriptional regulator [Staphylococcus pseudoxylosus]MCE5001650.1 TetR/AcrR family transcriptional regulator [Staphylococcus pseudoxylosus]MDW8546262.1 TetR/AcrR family transcriptional regulator [Staphylococcus pseudoxylosus]MEB6170460.1 TetR/AcrR family transcriptional regulator [Staphylococcus pseudoxylosus]
MDKRKEKSRQLIIENFIMLMQKKDIAKISMKDIAEVSNINRGTIYLNFLDKYDILNQSLDFILAEAIEKCESTMNLQQDGKANMREILIAIDKQYFILKQLIQKSDLNILRQTLSEKFMQNIKQKDNEIALQFLGSAIVGVIIWWIAHSRPCSIDELSTELWHLLEPHIDTFL